MVHKGPLVDVILGLEYQHYDVSGKTAFCATLQPVTIADYGSQCQRRHRSRSPHHQRPRVTGSTTADRFQTTDAKDPGQPPGARSLRRARAETNGESMPTAAASKRPPDA